jgi:hypothetical protein
VKGGSTHLPDCHHVTRELRCSTGLSAARSTDRREHCGLFVAYPV